MSPHPTMKTIPLGSTGPQVSQLGFGCMALSGMYGPSDEAEGIATIQAAIDAGITLLDTGDFYGMGHNELLLGRALQGRRQQVRLSVKFGALRGPDGAWLGFDARPALVKAFAAYSLKRLGVEVIDVYRPSRLDPNVPIEETAGAVADLIRAGHVKHLGLSEVGADTIRRAHAVTPVTDLQIEYSLASRAPEAKLFPALHELGISATLYGLFSRGLLTGSRVNAGDFRAFLPRFSAEHRAANDARVATLHAFARDQGMTPAQVAVAWVMAREPQFVPLLGARNREQLRDALGALEHPLDAAQLAQLQSVFPAEAIGGTRYGAEQMRHLDSEK